MWWGDKCKSGQHKEQGPSRAAAFRHRGSAPQPIKVRDVTSPGARIAKGQTSSRTGHGICHFLQEARGLLRVCALLNKVLLLTSPFATYLKGSPCCVFTSSAACHHKHCKAVLAVKCLTFSHGAHLLQRLLPGLHVLNETLILMHLPSAEVLAINNNILQNCLLVNTQIVYVSFPLSFVLLQLPRKGGFIGIATFGNGTKSYGV